MQLEDKKVMVYGAAKSGISATRLLQRLGASVILYDGNVTITKFDFVNQFDIEDGFTLITGSLSEDLIDSIDLLVISPGVPCDHPDIVRMKEKNIPVWGEIELAFCYTKGKVIGITGTNGKTTTTTLVGKLMKSYFPEVFVVGNIGKSYTDVALDTRSDTVTVIELSSFQLETIQTFKPDVSTILNITPDHLDRHHTMEEYIAMKERIALNQSVNELCILNYEDEILRNMAARLKTKVLFFSSKRELEEGLYLEEDEIYYSRSGEKKLICDVNRLRVIGRHNYENIMAAVGIALQMGVPMEYIRKTLFNFKGVEHRIEYVETIHGVTYYNDSKGTNPDASIKAIQAMKGPTVLIAGGYDKKVSFVPWLQTFQGKVKCLVLIGQTKKQIAKEARHQDIHNIYLADSLEEAVRISASQAKYGDNVLLSPACASWGMFDDFEQRGNLFKQYVRSML
ncbi:MAG: murD [Herbinix sp.]|nr:murD [Herbinix sp.]